MRDTLRQIVLDILNTNEIGAANISFSETGYTAKVLFSDDSYAYCAYLNDQWVDAITLDQITLCRD